MNSISFPKMFNNTSTNVVKDYDATLQDVKLLLCSEKGELFGDPFFGIRLKRYMFNQNNYVLRDILLDEIFTQLVTFAPQLSFERKDISIIQRGKTVYAKIKALNKVDFTTNTYELVLMQDGER